MQNYKTDSWGLYYLNIDWWGLFQAWDYISALAADPKRLWLSARVWATTGDHFGNKNNSCFPTLASSVGLNYPKQLIGNQSFLIVRVLLASTSRDRFEATLNCRGERWPLLQWEDDEQNVSGLLHSHCMGVFALHSAWTTDAAGYYDTLVAKQRGHHKQIPHSQNESLLILFHKALSFKYPCSPSCTVWRH